MRQSRTVRWMDGAAQVLIGATAVVAVCMAMAGGQRDEPPALRLLAALADHGDAPAARVAAMMVRQGPQLFGQRFDVSPERLARWQRTMRGDTVALADVDAGRLVLETGAASRGMPARASAVPVALQLAHAH